MWQIWVNFILGALVFILGLGKGALLIWLFGLVIAILSLWTALGKKS